jgi:hypothetical protein
MIDFTEILNAFDPITLEEMDSVKLLDRTDTKFTFKVEKLPFILYQLKKDYRVLDVDGLRLNKYETLYFDTPEFNLYTQHHNGKLNRYKVRFRRYVDSGLNFFEVKFKNNKGRTLKSRVKRKNFHDTIEGKSEVLLNEKSPLSSEMLKPVIWVNYTRITLVSKHTAERLTIDINLNFKNSFSKKAIPSLVIAEVKQDKAKKSAFITLMNKRKIYNASISKYCFGILSLYENIKKNNFKIKLKEINKIAHDYT